MAKEKKKHLKKEKKKHKEKKTKDYIIEVSQTQNDVKTFIKKFKSDVNKKRKGYQSYAKRLQKKKKK